MRCLSDAELQALADGESNESASSHVADCSHCRARLDVAQRTASQVAVMVNGMGDMPLHVRSRVRQAIVSGRHSRGATTLRAMPRRPAWRRPALVSAVLTAAVVAFTVFGILPRFGAPTTLSASEVLSRSLQTLSGAHGVEFLEYDLIVDGLTHGSWRIEQLIDHEQPARYRIAVYTSDGSLHSAISQDPARQQRSQLVRVDGRNYIVNVDSLRAPVLSLPQMGQALVETAVGMMQASADQHLSVVDRADGRHYVVEIPPVQSTQTASTLELYRARTVVSDGDFRIEEFEAAGALLRQPFNVSFKLLRRTLRAAGEVPAQEFVIPTGPRDIVLNGTASEDPVSEFLTTIVRELTAGKLAR